MRRLDPWAYRPALEAGRPGADGRRRGLAAYAAAGYTGPCGTWILVLLVRLPLGWYFTRLAFAALILGLFVVFLPFLPDPRNEYVNIGPLRLSWHGLTLAGVLLVRGLTLATLALVLLAASPLEDTFKAAHALHVPALLVHLALLAYRYVFLLARSSAGCGGPAHARLSQPPQHAQLSHHRSGGRHAAGARPRTSRADRPGDALPRLRRRVSIAARIFHDLERCGCVLFDDRLFGGLAGLGPLVVVEWRGRGR